MISAPDSLDRARDILDGQIEHPVEFDLGMGDVEPADAGERQQVVDEHLHAFGSVDGEPDVFGATLVELIAVSPFQELAERNHLAQRFLQIVRRHVGELLQFGVGSAQFDGLLVEYLGLLGQSRSRRTRFVEFGDDALAHVLDVATDGANVPRAGGHDPLAETATGDPPARRGQRPRGRVMALRTRTASSAAVATKTARIAIRTPLRHAWARHQFVQGIRPCCAQVVVLGLEEDTDIVEFGLSPLDAGGVGGGGPPGVTELISGSA